MFETMSSSGTSNLSWMWIFTYFQRSEIILIERAVVIEKSCQVRSGLNRTSLRYPSVYDTYWFFGILIVSSGILYKEHNYQWKTKRQSPLAFTQNYSTILEYLSNSEIEHAQSRHEEAQKRREVIRVTANFSLERFYLFFN